MRIARAAPALLAAFGAAFGCLPDLPVGAATDLRASCGDGVVDLARESCDPGPTSAPGCTRDCTLSCEGALAPTTAHCYFAQGVARSFAEAASRCRGAAAHLVTLGSASELVIARSLATAPLWIDLTRSGAAGAYVTSLRDEHGIPLVPTTGPCSGCFAPGVAAGAAVPPLDPDAPVSDCVVLTGETFAATTCANTAQDLAVVCEREPPGSTTTTCIDGLCTDLRESPKTLVTLVNPVAFASAAERCAELGGRMWIPASADERLVAARGLTPLFGGPARVWVGLASMPQGWVWGDGVAEAARPPPWADRQPESVGEAAAVFALESGAYDTGLLRARPVTERNPVVCEVPRITTSATP